MAEKIKFSGFLIFSVVLLFESFILSNPALTASRAPVRGKNGMVVTSHELASEVGVQILKKGGNAVDAAVAVGFALAVVYPTAGNLGGGGFMVIRFPDGRATTIDYREKAPARAHRDMYLDDRGNVIPKLSTQGYLACGVPGSVAGLTMALEKYGTMSLKQVIQPAIKLAEKGFPVSYGFHQDLKRLTKTFLKFPASAKVFLKNGQPYDEGDIFVQKDLARTLKLIAKKGARAFYQGKIAHQIAQDMERHGGLITEEDLTNYRAVERKPVRGSYRGYEIISMGPPSSGGVALIQLLNILEDYNIEQMGYNSSQTIHIMAEAMRRVFADRAYYLGDADFLSVPVKGLISKGYADSLRKTINPHEATPSSQMNHGNPYVYEAEHTTHYSIVDRNGMAVATTTTLNSGYGSKVVIEGAGFLMNNEMDDFSVKPGAPNIYGLTGGNANAIEPGKRMLSSMTPTILVKAGKVFMVVGAAGGPRIITTVFQIIINVIDHRMNIQEAIDGPRFHHQWLPDHILYEKIGFPRDVLDNLVKMGHTLKKRKGYQAEAHGILMDWEEGVLLGAADPRRGGKAVGY